MDAVKKVIVISAVLIALYLVLNNFLGAEGVIGSTSNGYVSAVKSLQGR